METLQNIMSQQIIQKLGWTLIHFVWQGLLATLLLAVALRFMRKSSSNLRYITACMVMVVMIFMPVITFRTMPVAAQAKTGPQISSQPQVTNTPPQIEMPKAEKIVNAGQVTLPKWTLKDRFIKTIESLLPHIVIGWLIGVFVLSIWYLGGWTQLQRLRRQMVKQVTPAIKAKLKQLSQILGIRKTITIAESALVNVPTVIGHLKPIILLPASVLTGLSNEQIEAILAHELAHIKRCDYLVNILQTVVEILGFYHPAVWWVSNKIRAERENCCDDLAVSVSGNRVCYAEALATMEEIRTEKLNLATEDTENTEKINTNSRNKLAVAASGGSLFNRICRLLGRDASNQSRTSWIPSIITIILIIALLIPISFAVSSKAKPAEQGGSSVNQQQTTPNTDLKKRLQNLVEDFFKHNYRDITARKTIEWGEPIVDVNGNMSICYEYEMIIWDKDKFLADEIFTFDKDGKFVNVQKVKGFPKSLGSVEVPPEDVSTKESVQKLVEKFFTRNYRDITARKTLEWGEPVYDANGNVSIRYKYEATIWGKSKVINDEIFTFDKNGQFVSVKKVGLKDVSFYEGKDPNESGISVYSVNRKVSSYPARLDFSKPEYTFVIAKRISADGNDPAWPQISEPHLAAMMDKNKTRRSVKPKVAEEYLNTEIIEVHTKGGRASVIGRIPALIGGYNIRGFKLVDGRWLNTGEGGALTLAGARAVADQGVDYHDFQDRSAQLIDNSPNSVSTETNSVRVW